MISLPPISTHDKKPTTDKVKQVYLLHLDKNRKSQTAKKKVRIEVGEDSL